MPASGAKRKKSEAVAISFRGLLEGPRARKEKSRATLRAFRDAKVQTGEDAKPLTMEAFQRFVRQKTEQLKKQKNAHEVEYIVTLEGNHARLKARVKS